MHPLEGSGQSNGTALCSLLAALALLPEIVHRKVLFEWEGQ